jgi:retron-type reverse transcriptase
MDTKTFAAKNLAARLLANPFTRDSIAATLKTECPQIPAKNRRALANVILALGDPTPPAPAELAAQIRASSWFKPARPATIALAPPLFAPAPAFANLSLPPLTTTGDLAAWAGVTPEQLHWLADTRHCHHRAATPKLQHYHYAFIPKSAGPPRLIEAPKPTIKAIQRKILDAILARIPVHDAAHGFIKRRSPLTGAQIHAAESVLITFDLKDFFPSLAYPRVHGLFRAFGYPHETARALAGLCTTTTPETIRAELAPSAQALHAVLHLPQGAPTSPALANLLAWKLDRRLAGLAKAAGAHYTRYADDLAFSGDESFVRRLENFRHAVAKITTAEGFALNHAKTRTMPASARQLVTGILVNRHCNTGRADFDRLKATPHNCARVTPAAQNLDQTADFRAHLAGRIAWQAHINPARGAKLYALFDAITW